MNQQEPAKGPPSIFRAATNNDVAELALALQDGQTLSDQDPDNLLMTPVHVAALNDSAAFLDAAKDHASFDPWIRDANLRRPIEHASAFRGGDSFRILSNTMFGDLFDLSADEGSTPTPMT